MHRSVSSSSPTSSGRNRRRRDRESRLPVAGPPSGSPWREKTVMISEFSKEIINGIYVYV